MRSLPLHALLPGFSFCRRVLSECRSFVSLRALMLAPFFSARAISPFLLAKDTAIVNAVNERFGLADRAYVAERKYKAHMAKLERGQTTINNVSRTHVAARSDCPNRRCLLQASSSSPLAECGVEHTRPRAGNASGPAAAIVFRARGFVCCTVHVARRSM